MWPCVRSPFLVDRGDLDLEQNAPAQAGMGSCSDLALDLRPHPEQTRRAGPASSGLLEPLRMREVALPTTVIPLRLPTAKCPSPPPARRREYLEWM